MVLGCLLVFWVCWGDFLVEIHVCGVRTFLFIPSLFLYVSSLGRWFHEPACICTTFVVPDGGDASVPITT